MEQKIALLHQAQQPPAREGIIKPMKIGGYSDSSADIAFSLQKSGCKVVFPVEAPHIDDDQDWSFPDTISGINKAIEKGATTIWLNTVLYKGHPIEGFKGNDLYLIGQIPAGVEIFDDKIMTNMLLRKYGLPVPDHRVFHQDHHDLSVDLDYPVVVKPIRGRGSQGVGVIKTDEELKQYIELFFKSNEYGTSLYIESFLPGEELTITVMPPGQYFIDGKKTDKKDFWSLPPVRRFNHKNGIAPYNGTVAVINNSAVLSDSELLNRQVINLMQSCERAAEIVKAKAPIRIDCRADSRGNYFLFDLNMKPNMTGPSRPMRKDQDSLSALAARKIGWSYDELLINIKNQSWEISLIDHYIDPRG